MIRITELKLGLNDALNHKLEMINLRKLVLFSFKIKDSELQSISIYKKAIDARKKDHVFFVYSVDIELENEKQLLQNDYKNVSVSPILTYDEVPSGNGKLLHRPVIVGFGPSGMFAALLLARRGYRPIILERGLDVENRTTEVNTFFETGKYHDNASILFGEGGAGTFSDGKLTTLINDVRCRLVLDTFVMAGAPEEILYINKPHIGTDILRVITKKIRNELIELGAEIRFLSQVTDFILKDNKLQGVVINNKEIIETNVCLFGIGHSARDTFKMIYDKGISIQQKPFSIGVRIEHPQSLINQVQYGKYANHPSLGAADYKLSYHSKNNRSAYTFCMCPGGSVVCGASALGEVLTNGMSESKRDKENANSALLVNVIPSDFGSSHPLAGVEFQRQFEKKAYLLGGSNYYAPIQLLGDFLKDKQSTKLGVVKPSYKPGVTFVKMSDIFPTFVIQTMKESVLDFDRKLKGFALEDAVLTGVETRSSSPVRIVRNDNHESSLKGLYPMGEGAGYAGGIMSSAVDGIKTAEKIIQQFYL
ncbi:MAG: hypothetical protein PHC62_07485 [Candidatus Izemoplasmatales bacterium]|nr:hypothetical protein [Candidatus Izemoplasmatales bacterium]